MRLHFLIVDHLAGAGFVVAGWVADPLSEAAGFSFVGLSGDQVEVLSASVLLTEHHEMRGFDVPGGMRAKFGFVLLAPAHPTRQADGVCLRVQYAGGDSCDHVVPPVGDISQLADILATAPLDYRLRIINSLLNASCFRASRTPRLPERLEALALRIHQTIDPRRDYGAEHDCANVACHVDAVIRVGTKGILLAGWLLDDDRDRVKEVALVSLFGRRSLLETPLPAKSRPDVLETLGGASAGIDCGFAVFAPVEGLDRLDTLCFLEIVMASGAIRRAPFICPPEPAPLQGIEAAVVLAERKDRDLADLFERALSPAVDWFWAQTRCPGLHPSETAYGDPPIGARVSVVVPIYGRLDFVRHQIAQFSNDPEFRADAGMVELIYVLDDPAKEDEFGRLCRLLHGLYGIAFRTLVQGRNLGYSAANNAAAAVSRGQLLLLLNSDVFPCKPGWVGQLARTYDGLDQCGVLGCRLLFEDGSIQHAGMSFRDSDMLAGCWENDHPGRGLSVSFDTHAGTEPVPAVTGACLMISRALFDTLGGMSEAYVIGDFEDSDLCLRAQERGFKVYYTPDVELYHLERQSMRLIGQQSDWWRQSLTLYNMWTHGQRWSGLISRILEAPNGSPVGSRQSGHEALDVISPVARAADANDPPRARLVKAKPIIRAQKSPRRAKR